MPGILTICATPIGNLGDAPPRLAAALEAADMVYAEDTRRTRSLLNHLGVEVPLRSYFVGNEAERAAELEDRLGSGQSIVLVSDAGTPAIADPGVSAVRAAVTADAQVTVVPGPSAVTGALAVSGFGSDRFVFEGFLPRSGERRLAALETLAVEPRTVVVFSATGRVAADLADLSEHVGTEREIVVVRELTKLHEEVWRGSLAEAATRWNDDVAPRGEFTFVVGPSSRPGVSVSAAVRLVHDEERAGKRRSEAVRSIAADTGVGRRVLYEAVLAADDD